MVYKVAFLTSIYGIAFALIYSSGMKSVYSGMDAKLQGFLERFHLYVLPAAESEYKKPDACKSEGSDKSHETDGRAAYLTDGREF